MSVWLWDERTFHNLSKLAELRITRSVDGSEYHLRDQEYDFFATIAKSKEVSYEFETGLAYILANEPNWCGTVADVILRGAREMQRAGKVPSGEAQLSE